MNSSPFLIKITDKLRIYLMKMGFVCAIIVLVIFHIKVIFIQKRNTTIYQNKSGIKEAVFKKRRKPTI